MYFIVLRKGSFFLPLTGRLAKANWNPGENYLTSGDTTCRRAKSFKSVFFFFLRNLCNLEAGRMVEELKFIEGGAVLPPKKRTREFG
jgi:hypothetical protein